MGFRAVLSRIPRAAWGLLALEVTLLLLLLASVNQWLQVGAQDARRANSVQQRIVIDVETGTISGLSGMDEAPPSFDVAPDEETQAPDTPPEPQPVPADEEAAPPKEDTPAPAPAEEAKPDSASATEPPPAASATEAPAAEAPAVASDKPALVLDAPPVTIAAIARSKASLAAAPAPEVTDKDAGNLPKRGERGAAPSEIYARPFNHNQSRGKPIVALVITGLGLDAGVAKEALALPAEVTLAFSPYGEKSGEWAGYARNLGHEVWLEQPAETAGFPNIDPGPMGIHRGLSGEGVISHMRAAMKTLSGFVGIFLPPGQQVLEQSALIMPVIEELRTRGLLLGVGSSKVTLDSLSHLAEAQNDILLGDIVADATPSADAIGTQLQHAEERAVGGKPVIVVLQATPLSLRMAREWTEALKPRSIVLAPLSAFASMEE